MEIRIFDTPRQACQAAALVMGAQIVSKPDSILGLATGSTPIPAYQELIRLYKEGIVDFSRVRSFNLDEYVGIPEDHPCSYHRFMRDELFDHVNILKENTHVPSGLSRDLEGDALAYDAAIEAAGGLDIQLLGIGRNGHIGFNEPADVFTPQCHVVELTESTIDANKRFFDSADDVPRRAVSLGVGTIMKAATVLLIATGEDKAEAVRLSVKGEITPRVPASILKAHRHVLFFLDQAAASRL